MGDYTARQKELRAKYGVSDNSPKGSTNTSKNNSHKTNSGASGHTITSNGYTARQNELRNKYGLNTYGANVSGVNQWFADASEAMQSMQSYNEKNKERYTANYGGTDADRIRKLLDSSGEVWDYLYQNRSNFQNYDEINSSLNEFRTALKAYDRFNYDLRKYYDQFEDEEEYNTALRAYGYQKKYEGKTHNDIQNALNTLDDGEEKNWLSNHQYELYRDTEDFEEKSASGWNRYESDRTRVEESAKRQAEDKNWLEKVGEYLGGVSDTTMPMGNTSQIIHNLREDTSWSRPTDKWNDEQRSMYGYLYETDRDAAYMYARNTSEEINSAELQEKIDAIDEWSTRSGLHMAASTVAAIATMPLSLADTMSAMTEYQARGFVSTPDTVMPGRFNNAVTGAVSAVLNDEYGTLNEAIPVFGGKGVGDVYQLGTSIANSMLSAYTQGSVGTYMVFFGSAAASGMYDAKDRGASDKQAIYLGIANGLAEAAGEAFSVEKLLSREITGTTLKSFFLNVLQQAGFEASEEGMTTLLNNVADQLIMGDLSNFNVTVSYYMKQGLNEKEAKRKAWAEMAENLIYDVVGGFVSGGVSGGLQTGVQSIFVNDNAKKTYGAVQDDLVQEALEINPNSKYAQKLQAKLAKGKNLSGGQLNELVQQNEAAMTAQDTAAIQSAAEARLTELGETGDVTAIAAALTKQASGERLSRKEQQLITGSKYGQRVSNELNTDNIRSGETSSDWAQQIGTNRINVAEYSRLVQAAEMAQEPSSVSPENGVAQQQEVAQAAEQPTEAVQGTVIEPIQTAAEVQISENAAEVQQKETVTLESASKKYGAQAGAMIHTYQQGQDVEQYDAAYQSAYDMGKSGVNFSYAMKSASTSYLTDTQRELAYEAGAAASKTAAKTRQAEIGKAANGKKGRRKGTVRGEGVKISDLKKTFNDPQNRAYKILVGVSEATGINIVLYKSQANDNGVFEGSQGKFKWSNDTIYIDVNAGLYYAKDVNELQKYTMLRTFSHEFTHFIEKWNPVRYNEFRKVVFDTLTEHGENVHDLIELKMEQTGLDYDGSSREVVADAMTDILPDAHFVEQLAQKHSTIFDKLLEKLKDFAQTLRDYFDGLGHNPSREANALKEQIEDGVRYVESIVKLFDNVAVEAVESYQAANAVETFSVNDEIVNLVKRVQAGDFKPNEKVSLGVVDNEIAKRIHEIIGIDVTGYHVALEARQVEHILKDHGKHGRTDRSMAEPETIARMVHVLTHADEIRDGGTTQAYVTVKDGKNRPAKTVLYEKLLADKSYYVVQAVPETKKKTLYIVTAFIGESGYKKEEVLQSTDTNSPSVTPEAESVSSSSNSIIHNVEEKNNREVKAEPKTTTSDNGYTITDNTEFNSIEIKFNEKPSAAVRDILKNNKFRWNGKKGVWYGKGTHEAIQEQLDAVYAEKAEEPAPLETAEQATSEEVKQEPKTEVKKPAVSTFDVYERLKNPLSFQNSFAYGGYMFSVSGKAGAGYFGSIKAHSDEYVSNARGLNYQSGMYEQRDDAIQNIIDVARNNNLLEEKSTPVVEAVDVTPTVVDETTIKEERKNEKQEEHTAAETEHRSDGLGTARLLEEVEAGTVQGTGTERAAVAHPAERGVQAGRDDHRADAERHERGHGEGSSESGNLRGSDRVSDEESAAREYADKMRYSLKLNPMSAQKGITQVDIYDKDNLPTFTPVIINDASDWNKVKEDIDKREEADKAKAAKLKSIVVDLTEQQSTELPKGRNFVIGDSLDLPKGEKARYKANVDAIRLVKKLEAENRFATPTEQEVLSKYVGWGGLANAFDQRKSDWSKEYAELKELLTDEEYKQARGSTLNAHYTEISVIKAMYDGLKQLGFKGGRMLEPSSGVGNFVGAMPADMTSQVTSWTMVELDGITGKIAKYLYPNADVRIQGFEKANIPNNFMDVAISNVPFGNYGIADKSYPKKVTSAIHNYFFAKSLDKVRPGGIVMFITSSYTMNSSDTTVRKYIMDRADLLGAIRLPNTAFKGNAGTEVVTDILVLKKREAGTEYAGEDFLEAPYTRPIPNSWNGEYINDYFTKHPEMVLGTPTFEGSMYRGNSLTYKPLEGKGSLADQIREAFSHIQGKMDYTAKQTPEKINFAVERATKKTKNKGLVVKDGKVYENNDGELIEKQVAPKVVERVSGMLGIRDAHRALQNALLQGQNENAIKKARRELNKVYDEFVKKHGYINAPANRSALADDPDKFSLYALENYDPDTKKATKADIFTKNTIAPNRTETHADDVPSGLIISMNRKGGVDVPFIAKLTGKTETDVTRELVDSRLAYKTRNGGLEAAEVYLSGNVRAKLRDAEALVPFDKDYQKNVDALKEIIPEDVPYHDIHVTPGSPWIPASVYSDFAAYMLGSRNTDWRQAVDVSHNKETGNFTIELKEARLKGNFNNTQKWGTNRRSFLELLDAMMNSKSVVIKDKVGENTYVINKDATAAANEKIEEITKEFQDWLWRDEARRTELSTLYNEVFNALVTPKYNGDNLTVDGANPDKPLRPHQRDAVQRIISSGGNTLLAHKVGAGKTYEMAAAAMKLKQLGIVNKPMFAVPKSLVAQWGKEFLDFFPTAKLLVAEPTDFTAANRKTFANRIANGDYDAVIVSYEQFEKLPISDDFALSLYQEQIDSIVAAIVEAKAEKGGKSLSVKDLEKKRKSLQTKIDKLTDTKKDADNIEFEQLGVDALFIDEAHNFKNLMYTTSMNNVAGLGNKDGSKRAFDLYTKVRYLQKFNGGRGIVFATATPVMNSMSEMYIMQRYLQPDLLEQQGLHTFDAWAKQFGEVVNGVEIKPSGQGYRVKQSFSRFKNMNELQMMFRSFADVLTDVPGLKIPKMKGGAVNVVVCEPGEFQKEYMKQLEERAENVKNVDPSIDNMLKITSDGRKVAYTQRMIDPSLPYEDGCKIYRCADNVARVYKESKANKGTQLIFCDMATPKGKAKTAAATATEEDTMDMESAKLYNDIRARLVKSGIPKKEIAFIHEADTDAKKKKLFADVNDGKVRVLIGSTGKMGVGMNAQKRIVAIHHLDAPWRPGDVEQRNGRAYRQGNINEEVECFTYVTEGSFDARLWDILDRKQGFINQIMNGENVGREVEDTGEVTLSAAEVKALASGSPLILEQVQLDTEIKKLESLQRAHRTSVANARMKHDKDIAKIAQLEKSVTAGKADVAAIVDTYSEGNFSITIGKKKFTDKKDAGVALMAAATKAANEEGYTTIASFAGFDLRVIKTKDGIKGLISGKQGYGFNTYPGNTTYMINHLVAKVEGLKEAVDGWASELADTKADLAEQEKLMAAPFAKQAELDQKRRRHKEIMDILTPKEEQTVDSLDEDKVQYQQRGNIDSDSEFEGENYYEESQYTEVLGERKLSTVDGSENGLRQHSENSEKVFRWLEHAQNSNGFYNGTWAGTSGYLASGERQQSEQAKQPDLLRSGASFLRNLRNLNIDSVDTAGRGVPQQIQKRFSNTVLKDNQGRLLSVYHWTDAKFDVFAKGDIGFHFGALYAANKIYMDTIAEHEINESYYKECYLNIKNPVVLDYDPMTWSAFSTSYKLNEQGIISDYELVRLARLEGFYVPFYDSPASVELRRMLKEKGYDGIIYRNPYEGDWSVLAFYPEQVYTVAENGIDKHHEKYQQRTNTLSDREVLALAAEEISVDTLNDGEKDALRIFKDRLDKLEALQVQRTEAGQLYKEQQFGAKVDRAAAAETLERMKELDKQIQKAEETVLTVEDKAVLKRVLQKARKVVEKQQRAQDKEVLDRWRQRRNEAAAIKKYRDRIRKDVDSLSDWILHPNNKNVLQHVPDALKSSVVPFLTSIDFTSKRQLSGGEATKADKEFVKQLNAVKAAVKTNIEVEGLYSGYNDLPPDFMERLQTFIDSAQALVDNGGGELIINRMTAAELKQLSEVVRTLKKYIMDFNKFHANAMYQHVYEAGNDTISELAQMKDAGEYTGKVSNFLFWQQIRPAYAFERFGNGGMAIYDGLRRGQATLAFNTKAITDYAEQTYTAKEVQAWEKEIKTIELSDGEVVKMPVSMAMSFYELFKRPQAKQHILGQGIRVATYKDGGKKIADTGHVLTLGDVQKIISVLTPRQIEVADQLQKFMAEQGGKWGNHVSVARFGEELFGEKEYFPINSDGRHLQATADEHPSAASLYALLNMGFTKELNEEANNRIILYSIFDVFSNHMASMAQYNAFALPVLDALKWFNYQQRDAETKEVLGSVRDQMARVYGTPEESRPGSGRRGYAESFVINIIKAFNGTEAQGSPNDGLPLQMLHRYNMAQVAFNARVVVQQPLAITRAGLLVDAQSILRGLKLSPAAIRKNIEEMRTYSGIAAWKALGFYDVNISRGVTALIKHEENFMDKVADVGMKAAELADTVTWAAIWSACKEEVIRKQNLTPRDAGFFEAVTQLFEDVVYKTQVVDSVLTKNEYMRDKGFGARMISSFMSEPTTTASMLIDAYDKFAADMQRGMSRQQAWQKNGNMIARTFAVYGVGAVLLAAVQAVADAWRDDDEYQTFMEKVLEAFKGNLFDELNPLGKLPIVSDFMDIVKELAAALGYDTYGNVQMTAIGQVTQYFSSAFEILHDKIAGEKTNYTWYGGIYKMLQAVSGLTGLPMASFTREVASMWNNTIGAMAPSLKLKTYNPTEFSQIHYAYEDGWLTAEEATSELVEKGLADNEDEAYWIIKGWETGDGFSKYDALDTAVRSMGSVQEEMRELTSHGVGEKTAISHIKSSVGEWYRNGEVSKQQALSMVKKYCDLSHDDALELVNKWSCEVVTGISYDDIKTVFMDGNITASRAIDMRMRYGGYSKEDATSTIESWKFEKQYGFAYSDRVDAYKAGKVSEAQLRNILIGHGGMTELEADNYMKAYNWMKSNPSYDLDVSEALAYTKVVAGAGISVEESGIAPNTFVEYRKLRSKCRGVDADGDGQADQNTVKNEVLEVIDNLPITSYQKDVLYFVNGWARSRLRKAPWH